MRNKVRPAFYRNKKRGTVYMVLAVGRDCTNARDGAPVVIYYNADNYDGMSVRDLDEFLEKFEEVE